MFLSFFETLRAHGVPASPREYLSFLAGLDAGLATYDVDVFYYLARTALVKNEAHLDRFDQAFAVSFSGIEAIPAEAVIAALNLPGDWLKKLAEKHLSAAEKAEIVVLHILDQKGGERKGHECDRIHISEPECPSMAGNVQVGAKKMHEQRYGENHATMVQAAG